MFLAGACASDGNDAAPTVATEPSDAATTAPAVATNEAPPATDSPTTTEPGVVTRIAIEPSPYIGLAASVEVALAQAAQIEVTATSDDHSVAVPRTVAAAVDHEIPLVGMRAELTYLVDVEAFDEDGESLGSVEAGEFTTSALPEWFSEHEVTVDADRAAPGYTVLELDSLQIPEGAPSSQTLVAYDNDGEVVWYYANTGAQAGFEPTPDGTFNIFYWPFGIREIDMLGNVVGHWRPQPSSVEGDTVDDDLVIAEVDPDQVEFQGGVGALAGNPGDIDPLPVRSDWIDLVGVHHENWPMPNGNILTLSTTVHELTPEQRATFCPDDPAPFNAVSDVAVEFEPDGTVVRTWDLWDVVSIDEHPGIELCVPQGIFQEENTRDWTHANSAVYDPERDAIIISSRHTNQIVAFNHLDAEGPQSELRWILGAGATMPLDGEPTYYQHAVEVNVDGSLVVYDNGNVRPGTSADDPANPLFSRAVIYDVDDASEDPADWSARQRWEHIDNEASGDVAYAEFIGDADVLENGNVLITHGGIGAFPPDPADPLHILVREVVPDGQSGGDVVWEFRSAPNELWVTYRAERISSFYLGPDWVNE